MLLFRMLLVGLFCTVAAPSNAADENPCPKDLICASKPETVVSALQDAGFRAKVDKDKLGDPMISSEASGYIFDIYFYGCEKNQKCASMQFKVEFKPEDDNTPVYANDWNANYRFLQASVNDKKELQLAYDVSTVGGLNKANFTDIVENWASVLGDFSIFVKEQTAKAKK